MIALLTALLLAQISLITGGCGALWWTRRYVNLGRVLFAAGAGCGCLAGAVQHNLWITILNALQCGYWTYAAIAHRRDGYAAPLTRKDAP